MQWNASIRCPKTWAAQAPDQRLRPILVVRERLFGELKIAVQIGIEENIGGPTWTGTRMDTYVHTYIHPSIHACMHACMHVELKPLTRLHLMALDPRPQTWIRASCGCGHVSELSILQGMGFSIDAFAPNSISRSFIGVPKMSL